jgi:hypothetical protein
MNYNGVSVRYTNLSVSEVITKIFQAEAEITERNIILKKSKAVPLHAMEAHGGRGGIAPTHS